MEQHDKNILHRRGMVVMVIAIGIFVLAAVVTLIRSRPPSMEIPAAGPFYGGKRLSEWVEGYSRVLLGDSPRSPTTEATNAIRQIGTNAIPFLLEWMRYDQPAWKAKYCDESHYDPAQERAYGAADAFGILGAQAQGTLPELTGLLNSQSQRLASRAAFALGGLGTAGLPPLLAILTNQQAGRLRKSAASSIREMGTNASSAVPMLIEYLDDKDPQVALEIMAFFWQMESPPVELIPALVKCVEHKSWQIRRWAVGLLGRSGANGKDALSALRTRLNDEDSGVRVAATNALRQIEPKALERGDGG